MHRIMKDLKGDVLRKKDMHAIETINVTTAYDKGKELITLKDVNLQISEGEFVCFTGPSGCGKSTLLRMLCGLAKPDTGDIISYGNPITEPSSARIMVFQTGALFPWLTTKQNIEFGLKMAKVNEDKRSDIADRFLDIMALQDWADQPVHTMSVGMQQRAAIARALAIDADILLMDEPFSALDVKTKNELVLELQLIWKKTNKTIVFVTHDPMEAATLATRIIRFTSRPGMVAEDIKNNLLYPRANDDADVMLLAEHIRKGILNQSLTH